MWLINTESLVLEAIGDPEGYSYAVLSHTWVGGEVTFQEMADLDQAKKKTGFAKIQQTCQLALERGIKYAWVDTCCIDKSNITELTEAINSMFRWYNLSTICFVYLSDYAGGKLAQCRWFTRGWTLQELLAPVFVEFYDHLWRPSGTKTSLQKLIVDITGIDEEALNNSNALSRVCVARRLSWAAKRRTTRVEDLAYCLFGIFDVNLPLIYGEGPKAFLRLQEAIAAENNDLSIFAWKSLNASQAYRGVFASSPDEFEKCGELGRIELPFLPRPEYKMTNKGLQIIARLGEGEGDSSGEYMLDLHCRSMQGGHADRLFGSLFIRLTKTAHGFVRCRSHELIQFSHTTSKSLEEAPLYIPKMITPSESRMIQEQLTASINFKIINTTTFRCGIRQRPEHLWDSCKRTFITNGHPSFMGTLEIDLHRSTTTGVFSSMTSSPGTQQHDSRYIVIFGLSSPLYSSFREGESNMASFGKDRPWALLYKRDPKDVGIAGEISRTLDIEREIGFPQVLSHIKLALNLIPRGTRDPPEAVVLRVKPQWKLGRSNTGNGGSVIWTGKEVVDKSAIELLVEIGPTKSGSDTTFGAWDLVLKIQNESGNEWPFTNDARQLTRHEVE